MTEGIVSIQNLGKQQLLERCRELEFVDDVEDLKCTWCNRLALAHWYTDCGHVLCPNCKIILSDGGFNCPQCDQLIQHIKKQSTDSDEKLNGLRAKCPNSRYGCPFVTTVKQLQLLEEVSSLNKQMREMNKTMGFLLNELNERMKVEEEIKKSVEMSVEDIKSHLNGLASDLHYETATIKEQFKDFGQLKMKEQLELKNTLPLDINNKITTMEETINEINFNKFKDHFVSKEEVKQLQETVTEMNGNNKLLILMLDQKEDRFSQKLTKEVEAMDDKIVTSESKMVAAITKCRQETAAISKDLQDKVEKSSEELNAQWQKLSSDLNQRMKQMEMDFNQKLSNEVKQLDEKINICKTSVNMNEKEIEAKIEVMKSETNKEEVELNRQIATNVKNLQDKIKESIEELKQELVEVQSDMTQGLKQEQLHWNQELTEIKALEKKMVCKEDEIDKKMNSGFEKQEVASSSEVKRHVKGSVKISNEIYNDWLKLLLHQMSHDETKQLNEEIDQLNMKTCEFGKNVNRIFDSLLVDYWCKLQTIRQQKPQLNLTKAIEIVIAIEQLVNRNSSQSQLVDSFLFVSNEERMVFESLCFKWTINHFEQFKPIGGSREQLSDIFPVYGYQLKARLRLTFYSDGQMNFQLCLKDEAKKGQEVDIKPLPIVSFIIKDLSGHNKNVIKYNYCSFKSSLKYNQFGYWTYPISKSEWIDLISPCNKSLEVLVLVEPQTYISKPLSVNGTMTDTIEHYSRKLQMAKEGLIDGHVSSCFLTHAGGYRVAMRMWLDESIAYNKRGLVAWVRFLSGEFDCQLDAKFNHETSVTLINQLDAKKNITVERKAEGVNSCYLEIANEDEIGSEGFVVNDSLTYHVTIKPIK